MKSLQGEKVLIATSSFSAVDSSPMDRLRETGCEIINNPFKRKLTRSELIDLLTGGITGIIAGLEPLDASVLEKSALKVISRCGSGLSNVDLETAKKLGIKVYSTPDAPVEAVSELTLAVMLSLLRMIPEMDRDMHAGKWSKKIGRQLAGKTVVIIGFGRIGRKVASLIRPFDVRVIAIDPGLNKNTGGAEVFPVDKALGIADIITIHSSGEDRIIGEKEFKLIKKGTILLNSARARAVDEAALIQALEEGKIKGAWIDTFEREPYSGPLSKYPQVILTPHAGSYTLECRSSMEMEAVNNLLSGLKGRDL